MKKFWAALLALSGMATPLIAESGGQWGSATLVSTPDFGHRSMLLIPRVSVSPRGHVITTWTQSRASGTPTQFEQMSRHFTPATGWEAIQNLGQLSTSLLDEFGQNDAGRAAIGYFDTASRNVLLREYSPEQGWSPAPFALNDSILTSGTNAQVAYDDAGDGLAIWNAFKQDGNLRRHVVYSRRFSAAAGWGPIVTLVDQPYFGESSDRPALAMNQSGAAVVLWRSEAQQTGYNALYARLFDPVQGWSEIQLVSAKNHQVTEAAHPTAIDRKGNVQVLYSDSASDKLYFLRYEVSFGWTNPRLIDADPATYALPRQLASNQLGESLIVWANTVENAFNGTAQTHLFFRHFRPDYGTITPPRALHRFDAGAMDEFHVAINNAGHGMVVFGRLTSTNAFSVEGLEYSPSLDAWVDHQVIYAEQLVGGVNPAFTFLDLSFNQSGVAAVIWGVKNNAARTGRVWASLYN